MYKVAYFICLLYFGTCFCSVEEEWKLFKQNFKKTYETDAKEQKHFTNFVENYDEVNRHNALYDEGKVTYKKAITKFADLTGDEFVQIYGLPEGPPEIYTTAYGGGKQTTNDSDFLDWRQKGAVTRVKDQGTCGSCWIFSAVGVLEGYHFQKTNKLVALSEQNMVDCVGNDTCYGGWSPKIFEFLKDRDKGINREEDYPYKATSGKCRYDKASRVKIEFAGYLQIEETEAGIKEALKKHGPVLVMLGANRHWKLYKSGVWYEKKCSEWTNHSILLVGYGRENGHDYWLLKNSWGKDWGENGYIKYARNKHHNYCGFTNYAYHLL